ncbi:hypothetical protein LDB17_02755 [Dysgonomonas sp. Shenzhen-Wh21]|uniref:hypothetical protein n=1 Tax=Dysgonomonas TaxID=156973 RepID=UPI00208FF471|nr:hypothetical protein [Dysgonomonas mossii]
MKFGMKKHIKIKYVLISVTLCIVIYGIITHNEFVYLYNSIGITSSIQDSEKKDVFIKEVDIQNLQTLDSTCTFPIESIWLEKKWHWKRKWHFFKEVSIDNPNSEQIVFLFKNEIESIKLDQYGKDWIILSDSNDAVGHTDNIFFLDLSSTMKQPISFTIYRLKDEYHRVFDRDNNIPIFKFDIKRD